MASSVSAHPRHDVGYGKPRSAPVQGHSLPPRRAGEWFSRGLRLACSHGVRRVSTASVGRQFPGLGQGRPLRPISGAKRRHDLSREEPHLLEQQIRRFILEQADVTKGQGKMLEAALSKVFERVNHLVGASRDHVVAATACGSTYSSSRASPGTDQLEGFPNYCSRQHRFKVVGAFRMSRSRDDERRTDETTFSSAPTRSRTTFASIRS